MAKEKNLPNEVYLLWSLDAEKYAQLAGFKFADNVMETEWVSWSGILTPPSYHGWSQWPDKDLMRWKRKSGIERMVERTLGGAVIEALATAWKADLTEVLNNSELHEREKGRIGTLDGRPLTADVAIIRRRKARGR